MSEGKEQRVIKVLMVCAAGMSSSLLEIKIRQAAANAGILFELKAVSAQEIGRWTPRETWYDIVLIAPQVRYKRRSIAEMAEPHGIIVQDIDTVAYGMVDGEKIFRQIIAAIGERDKG